MGILGGGAWLIIPSSLVGLAYLFYCEMFSGRVIAKGSGALLQVDDPSNRIPRMNIVVLAIAFAITLIPRLGMADGIVMKPHVDGWRPAAENSQRALITYTNGMERLTVAIEVDAADAKSAVWLLPIPAAPKEVKVDVLTHFPSVRGTEVYGGAVEYLGNMQIAAVVLQVWPPVVGGVFYMGASVLEAMFGRSDPHMKAMKAAPAAAAKGAGVEVHGRVEKEGMVSEVITAKKGAALYDYLAGKGLNLKPGAVPTLDHYIGKNYTFVASWFSAAAESRAIEIRFPTQEMFFPLLPTSAYGDRVVPASIRVAGHVSPRTFPEIAARTVTGYYVSGGYGEGEHDGSVLGTALYTKIDINAPAKAFTQDLWISPAPPRQQGLELATFIVRHPVIAFVLLMIPVSMLMSLVAGWPIFRDLRTGKGALRLLLVGLGNCVTLLGMIATVRTIPGSWKRRIGFLFAFSLLFMLAMTVATWQIQSVFETMKPPSSPFAFPYAPPLPPKSPAEAPPPPASAVLDAAAKAAEAEGQYLQGKALENAGKTEESIRLYRRAARAGSGKAALRLGEIYSKGVPGVSRDVAESQAWYDTARSLGEKMEPAAATR